MPNEIRITDDANGGACSTVGIWDAGTRTCTFTSNVSERVVVGANNITLDGNGKTIDSGATSFNEACQNIENRFGVLLEIKTNVIVKNFTIKNFCDAMHFSDSISNSILDNTLLENYSNIEMHGDVNSIITGNTISSTHGTDYGYAILSSSDAALIENNNISGGYFGIYMSGADDVIIKNNVVNGSFQQGINAGRDAEVSYNTISNVDNSGIQIGYDGSIHHNTLTNNGVGVYKGSGGTQIYENDFINNDKGLQDASTNFIYHNSFLSNTVSATGNHGVFENQQQSSGNYWSDYSTTCSDNNNDNFCDDPYPFSGGTIMVDDGHVWKIDDGWLTQFNTPGDATIEAPDNSGTVLTYSSVTATHDGSAISVTCDTSSGTTLPIGTTIVLCTAQNGMKSTFNVTVNLETTSPVINIPSDITINLPQGSTNSTSTFSVTATDNFAVTVGPTCSAESGDIFQIGTNTVTCTAADAAGNTGTANFDIIVVEYDSTAPTVTVPISTTLYEVASNVGAIGTFSVSATDNVAVTVDPTCSHTSGSTFPVGSTTVTCTAEDANSNVGTASFTITVVEYVPPSITENNARFLDNTGTTISEISINQNVQITSDLLNDQDSDQSFAYWITYTGPQSDEMWITGQLAAGQSFSPSLSWIPTTSGTYTFTIKTVDNMTSKNQLSTPSTLQITIPEVAEVVDQPVETTTVTMAQGSSSPGCEPNCFIPSQVSVPVGSQVTFVNSDGAAHTTTGGTPSDGPNGAWDSSLIMYGSSYTTPSLESGTYEYFCMVHPWRTGTIYVGSGVPAPPQPDAELSISLNKSEFDLDELISVGANMNGITGSEDVTINVSDPDGTPVISRTLQVSTNSNSSFDFRISERFLVGYYKIEASSNVNGKIITDNVFFNIKSQYDKFQIESVQVTDQQGNPSSLKTGEMGYIKVVLTSNINIEPLVTVNLFDSSLTTLGVGSIRTPINEGESEIILSFMIPDDASVGTAAIYVNAFTNWVSSGGVSLTGEFSKSEQIAQ